MNARTLLVSIPLLLTACVYYPVEPTGPWRTLSETTDYDRKRLQLRGRYYGLGFSFEREGPGDVLGYDLSAEVGFQEESKRKT